MRVVYACDDNYTSLTTISAVSVLKHNPKTEIILLGCNLKDESIRAIKERIEKHNGKFRYVDVSAKINELRSSGAEAYVSYAVYSRIFISDLLPDLSDTVLYLDSDTLIVDSIAELFATELNGQPLALAPDAAHPAYKKVISLPSDKPYYNTGVALIDLGRWRELKCTERLLDELKKPSGRNPLGDQDIIVRVLNDDIIELDKRWNFLSQYIMLGTNITPAVYHFSGNTMGRPWYTSSKHPLRKKYQEAAKEAGLEKSAEQSKPMAFEYKVQYYLYKILPGFIFRPINNLMLRMHIKITYGI
jgi:lipopolysaccharide biosynthesis glycosyltransferase